MVSVGWAEWRVCLKVWGQSIVTRRFSLGTGQLELEMARFRERDRPMGVFASRAKAEYRNHALLPSRK